MRTRILILPLLLLLGCGSEVIDARDDSASLDSAAQSGTPPFASLHGTNLQDPILNRNEGSTKPPSLRTTFIADQIRAAKGAGWNVFRIVVRWEAYVDNKAMFLDELEKLVRDANAAGIWTWIDFHHYDCSSSLVQRGSGFPRFIVGDYIPKSGKLANDAYETAGSAGQRFWDDYYDNAITVNGKRVWDHQVDFFRAMIERVDAVPRFIGVEILNEPHVWRDAHYERIGVLHSYIGNALRKGGFAKYILFTRETVHGGGRWRISAREKFFPELDSFQTRVCYVPHLYEPPTSGFDGLSKLKSFQDTLDVWKQKYGFEVPKGIGEWAVQDNQIKNLAQLSGAQTQDFMDAFVDAFKNGGPEFRGGFMSTYWQQGGSGAEGNQLTIPGTGALTGYGEKLKRTIEKVYP